MLKLNNDISNLNIDLLIELLVKSEGMSDEIVEVGTQMLPQFEMALAEFEADRLASNSAHLSEIHP